ncbi:MAG: hypothetical protein KTR25_20860 [Myxococcales bacterium]|nr:hypothetical protein [Myxococcales bacterium]
MTFPKQELIDALRETAQRLEDGAPYAWTHMGACNCGHLAQTLTALSAAEIHAIALEKEGDWHDQVIEHCPTSGLPMDYLITELLGQGLTRDNLAHLERLSDPEILRQLPVRERNLSFRVRADVVKYLRVMANYLEHRLAEELHRVTREGMVRSSVNMSVIV